MDFVVQFVQILLFEPGLFGGTMEIGNKELKEWALHLSVDDDCLMVWIQCVKHLLNI